MKVAELSNKLNRASDVAGALRQLSALSQNSIARQVEDAKAALENCKQFCSAAAVSQKYAQITTILKFIHKANDDDGWLLPAAEIIFPSLITIYSLVLRSSDPDKKASPKPGSLNLAITTNVQKNREALRALCCIFDLCVDFCEVDWNETKKYLGSFARAAAAVLFGSNFQKERDTLNDTEYAMDELARYSSFALSHILLTKPSLIGDASKILGKRIPTLLTCLHSSPELSIQRSIILVVRLLYDNASDGETVPPDLNRRIENGLSATHFGNGNGIELFRSFDVNSDNSETQGEKVISKMLEDNEISAICFSCPCTVQMKGKVNGRTKKGGVLKASVDWNKNSIVVHVKNQEPAYFPLYTISTMKWVSGHKEIRVSFRSDSELRETQLVIQLKPGNRGYFGRAIEQRIQRILSLTARSELSLEEVHGPGKERKASFVYNEPTGESRDEESLISNYGNGSEDVPDEGTCHNLKPWEDDDEDIIAREHNQVEDNVADEVQRGGDALPVLAEEPPTVFSKIAADGGLLPDDEGQRNHLAHKSPEHEETEDNSRPTSLESEAMSPVEVRNPPLQGLRGDAKEVTGNDKKTGSRGKNMGDQDIVETPIADKMSKAHAGEESSHTSVESDIDKIAARKIQPVLKTLPDPSDPSWNQGNELDDSQDTGNRDVVMDDVHEKPAATKSKGMKSNSRLVRACRQQTTFQKKEMVSSGEDSEGSTAASIHSHGSSASKSRFCKEDEGVRIKLLSVVREVMKVRQKKSSKLAREMRDSVQQIRKARAKADKALLVKFAGIVKKQAGLQRRKITSYKAQKIQLLNATRDRVVKLKASLQDCLKKLRILKSSNNKEVGRAKSEMKRIREHLGRDLNECVKECLNRKNCRAKTDSLFQGLAKLLQDG